MRIYEINTRVHCSNLSEISQGELKGLSGLGFDAIWLMGMWGISRGVLKISKLVSEDFEGSPYAVAEYKFNKKLGGKRQFVALVERAHRAGLKVIVDFVSNHMSLDCPWIDEHPEFFITSDVRLRPQSTSDYFLHRSGELVAFGRDPYFPPWHDTAQLDYTSAGLRARMIETLKRISQYADGVRCDMAMLVLRDHIRRMWYPLADRAWFDRRMPGEFWDEAIAEVRKSRPGFLFIAEAYWDKEEDLIELGFDMAYEKKLYDGLVARDVDLVKQRIARGTRSLERSLNFIENHDEPRAASVFSKTNNLAAAALILSLPGSVLINEGQLEGFTEKLPVQRLKPVTPELPDENLKRDYLRLLSITGDDVFTTGELIAFDTGAFGVISFARIGDGERAVAYLGQISEAWHSFELQSLDVTALARMLGAVEQIRLTNLLTGDSLIVECLKSIFTVRLKDVGVRDEAAFCLLEVSVSEE